MARASINRDRRAKLWDAFRIFDADGNGLITAADLERVVLDLDQKIDPRKARAIIAEVYRDGPDAISFEDFQALMASEPGDREVRLRQAFDALDTHHKGQIEFADLEPVMVRFGIGFDELKAMFQVVDTDGDGSIRFAEFSELMPADSDQETARSDGHEFEHFDRHSVRPEITSDDRKGATRPRPERNPDESPVEASGTSLLQLQIGIFRLIQGAAYRCFRESFSENYETHLRVRNLPYRISDFVEFTELTLTIYKGLGVVDPACEPVIDAVSESIREEFDELKLRIAAWETISKTPQMLAEARRADAASQTTESLRQMFAAGIDYAIAVRKRPLRIREAAEGILAIHELNRLRRKQVLDEPESPEETTIEADPEVYLSRWNRVILNEGREQIPGAMMPVAYWYEKFMPRLLAAMSIAKPEDIEPNTVPDEAALDAWYRDAKEAGEFKQYGSDVEAHFPRCTPEQKLSVRQAWRLTRHYLNGVQKRRERMETGRDDGALSQYVAFLDVYLGRSHVRRAQMRLSFPYYLGPPVWRLLHTTAEIVCEKSLEIGDRFVSFFELFASMYPCPYCRHHLNAYVVQNREISMYPLEYLVLGYDPQRKDLRMSASEKLRTATTGPELRMFLWKLHNTVSSSIARTEKWYRQDPDAVYTTRYWPSLDSEEKLRQLAVSPDRIKRIYDLLRPVARLLGLRAQLQKMLSYPDAEERERIYCIARESVAALEEVSSRSGFLEAAYRFDENFVDPEPSFTPDDEAFARSGFYTEY